MMIAVSGFLSILLLETSSTPANERKNVYSSTKNLISFLKIGLKIDLLRKK